MSKRQTSEHARPEGRTWRKGRAPQPSPGSLGRAFLARDLAACRGCPGERAFAAGARHRARAPRRDGTQPRFGRASGFSLVRIAGGFALGAACGAVGAFAAARWRVVEELLAPLMALAKSVPVASITVLALIWLRAANLAVLVVLLVVLPIVYENILQGLRATNGSWKRRPGSTMSRLFAACLSRDANALPLSEHRTCARAQHRMESRSCGRGHRHTCRIARRSDLRREGLL